MTVKQLSIFIENRRGRFGEVLDVLKKNDVNILSLSLADTTEFGLLRLIVNAPERGRDALLAAGFSGMLTDVLVIKIPHKAGALQGILQTLSSSGISIEYAYGLSVESTDASIVIKTNDVNAACELLKKENIETMTGDEIAKL